MLNLKDRYLLDSLSLEQKGMILDCILDYQEHLKKKRKSEYKHTHFSNEIIKIVFLQISQWIKEEYNARKKEVVMKPSITKMGLLENDEYVKTYWIDTINKFMKYRGEANSKWKERRHQQKIFNIKMRLDTWKHNEETDFWRKEVNIYQSLDQFDKWMRWGEMEKMKLKLWIAEYNRKKELRKESALYLR